MTVKDEMIRQCTDEWCSLISKEHHKDKDMHFRIEVKYSYGTGPVYTAYHHGYINRFEETFPTLEEAQEYMIVQLMGMIEGEKEYQYRETT